MVDTVKLLIKINDPSILDGSLFTPITIEKLVESRSPGRTYLNPTPTYEKIGKYMPRLTFFKRPSKQGIVYQLAVEFSAPKLLLGNNFDELVDTDFEQIVTALQSKLNELLNYKFFKWQLAKADVGAWHPSKNIVFLDYTGCQTILNTLGKLDFSRIYDLQRTNFRDGHVLHVHCNSLDIAFYDKMADLRKAKVSDKRAFEDSGRMQMNLLEMLDEYKPLEVFRYEVRFVGRQAIKRAYPNLEDTNLESLFKANLCQEVLIKHWQKITQSIDMLALDVSRPYELLQNYIEDNYEATPQAALAAVAGLLINGQESITALRDTIQGRYGQAAWYRLKPIFKEPNHNRLQAFVHIDEALEHFTPTNFEYFKTNIANN